MFVLPACCQEEAAVEAEEHAAPGPNQVRGACPRPKRARISRAEEVGLPFYEAEPAEDGSDLPVVYKLKNERELMTAGEARALKQRTFPAGRFLFTRGKDPLAEVQLRFPWLFEEDEVSVFYGTLIQFTIANLPVN